MIPQLQLPITPRDFNCKIIPAGLAWLPQQCDSPEARAMLIAIALQESRLAVRWQVLQGGGKGPARGLLQFEQGTRASRGGVWGVYLHKVSASYLVPVCRAHNIPLDPNAIWSALETDDALAVAVARLLLLTDPYPLPQRGDAEAGWKLYAERTWRPGRPHRHTWDAFYETAWKTITEGAQ